MARLELDQNKLSDFVVGRLGVRFPPEGEPLENLKLSESEMRQVMADLGKYLAKLHSIELVKYGPPDESVFNNTGELVGTYDSWYECILDFFNRQSELMDKTLKEEEANGQHWTFLSPQNRAIFMDLMAKRPLVRGVMDKHRKVIDTAKSCLLNGNIHLGSIFVKENRFVGLGDFGQILIGDPVDDLAYFSMMPGGERLIGWVRQGWEELVKDQDFEQKLHLYRLFEAYRKIFTRYLKHRYLETYPEPLRIAQEELNHYNM